jgi:hypothetical protein
LIPSRSFPQVNEKATKRHANFKVVLCWVSGNLDIHRNEEVDKHAKLASESRINNSTNAWLPHYLHH